MWLSFNGAWFFVPYFIWRAEIVSEIVVLICNRGQDNVDLPDWTCWPAGLPGSFSLEERSQTKPAPRLYQNRTGKDLPGGAGLPDSLNLKERSQTKPAPRLYQNRTGKDLPGGAGLPDSFNP